MKQSAQVTQQLSGLSSALGCLCVQGWVGGKAHLGDHNLVPSTVPWIAEGYYVRESRSLTPKHSCWSPQDSQLQDFESHKYQPLPGGE